MPGNGMTQTRKESVWKVQNRQQEGLGRAVVVDWSTESPRASEQKTKLARKVVATKIVRFKSPWPSVPENGGDDQTQSVLSVRDTFTEAYLQRKWKRDVPPIEQEIEQLSALYPATAKAWNKTPKRSTIATRLLRRPSLDILRLRNSSVAKTKLSDQKLCSWLRSVDVLPLVKRWKTDCLDDPAIFRDLQRALPLSKRPWDEQVMRVATLALTECNHHSNSSSKTTPTQGELYDRPSLKITAKYAGRIAHGNTALWSTFAPPPTPANDLDRHLLATRVLFTVYADILRYGDSGFFGISLQSPLAGMLKTGIREN
ncbi:hypothetical protein LTR86_000780 [Recurvomyces mirabilis]|nr:hypothetical protein LTR86_000780 [Recurvomyces mirabilis]